MTLLSNTLSIQDGGLGVVSPGGRPVAVVGCCSAGTAATPVTCYTQEQLVAAGGYGPAVEDAAIILARSGGPVILCKAATVGEIEAQGWSLNPGRYVGVGARAADEFDFAERLEELNEELEAMNVEARELESRIAEGIASVLEQTV